MVVVTLWNLDRCYDFPNEDDDGQQGWECMSLSWLTLAGLGRSKRAAVYRLWSTLLVTITYSLILGIIMVICNVEPDAGYLYGAGLSWSQMEFVKDIFELNVILGSTIGLGWISFMLGIIITWCKSHDWRSYKWGPLQKVVNWFVDPLNKEAGFWDEAVLLQALA